MFNNTLRDPTKGTHYALLQSILAFCIQEPLTNVASSWIRKKLGLPNSSCVDKNVLVSISKAAWPNLKAHEVIQHQIIVSRNSSGLNPSKPNYPQKSSLPAKLNLYRDRLFEQTKIRKLTSLGPLKMPERSKKPALPRKLPPAKMTLELYNQGVQVESEPESDDTPESDPDGKFS